MHQGSLQEQLGRLLPSPLSRKIQIRSNHSPPRTRIEEAGGYSFPVDSDQTCDRLDVRVVKHHVVRDTFDIDHRLLAIAVVV
jgi:hypothetical protein